MEKNKKGNAYAALMVIVLITVLFIGYWAVMGSFATLYGMFTDDSSYNERYTTEAACEGRGYWDGTQCDQLPARAKDVLAKERKAWLIAPFIFVLGLILWYWSVTTKKDFQQFGGP